MEYGRVARHEHLAFHSQFEPEPLCAAIRAALDLPAFDFGSENETEWGLCERDGVEYNVSMPSEDGKLQQWDDTVPDWCNVGFSLLVARDHPRAGEPGWIVGTLVRGVGERLSTSLRCPLIHHRTSSPTGNEKFSPYLFAAPAKI